MTWRQTMLWRAGTAAAGALVVVAVVGSVGFAIDAWQGLAWAIGGASAWATAFALGAHETGRRASSWSLAGGLICGTVWALAWAMVIQLEIFQAIYVRAVHPALGFAMGVAAGVGGGLLGGIALSKRGVVLALAVGVPLGIIAAASMVQAPTLFVGPWIAFPLVGAIGALGGVPIGLSIGRWSRPTLFVFEELWPYLREMTVPFAGFVAGYLVLVLAFAGAFGTLWRVSLGSALSGVPHDPSFIDFVHASIGIATGTGGGFEPRTALAKLIVSAEAVFAQGWLIAVFAAVGAHLSPRFTRLAARRGGPAAVAPDAGASADLSPDGSQADGSGPPGRDEQTRQSAGKPPPNRTRGGRGRRRR